MKRIAVPHATVDASGGESPREQPPSPAGTTPRGGAVESPRSMGRRLLDYFLPSSSSDGVGGRARYPARAPPLPVRTPLHHTLTAALLRTSSFLVAPAAAQCPAAV